jgi:hypothetical protein
MPSPRRLHRARPKGRFGVRRASAAFQKCFALRQRDRQAAVECGAPAPLSLTKAELPFHTPKTLRVQKHLPGHSPVILTQNA